MEAPARGRAGTSGGRVLVAGGSTADPTVDLGSGWQASPSTWRRVPDEHVTALRRLAGEQAVPLSSVLLAAHAKVLAALSGEREVVTGYVAVAGGPPLPLRLTTEPRSWRALSAHAHRGRVGAVVAHGSSRSTS